MPWYSLRAVQERWVRVVARVNLQSINKKSSREEGVLILSIMRLTFKQLFAVLKSAAQAI